MRTAMYRFAAIAYLIFLFAAIGFGIYLAILIVKALKKYINSKEFREEKNL